MHLSARLPKVEPLHIEPPTQCPLRDPKNPKKKCNGTHFKEHQWDCRKPVRDTAIPSHCTSLSLLEMQPNVSRLSDGSLTRPAIGYPERLECLALCLGLQLSRRRRSP